MRQIRERLLPPRRSRANPRVVNRKMSNWALKRTQHRNPPPPATPDTTLVGPTKATPARRKTT
ncbi:hypothetical protein C3Y87_20735 [Carbonactinospora thermoautotrophica]|nr:hypothetical protein [Carbonactinospora thermoautotrophica]MCX9193760.1 hypothetical protein [Carbonactinospora thermoautotrophica]